MTSNITFSSLIAIIADDTIVDVFLQNDDGLGIRASVGVDAFDWYKKGFDGWEHYTVKSIEVGYEVIKGERTVLNVTLAKHN
jgi:hypothetical protein